MPLPNPSAATTCSGETFTEADLMDPKFFLNTDDLLLSQLFRVGHITVLTNSGKGLQVQSICLCPAATCCLQASTDIASKVETFAKHSKIQVVFTFLKLNYQDEKGLFIILERLHFLIPSGGLQEWGVKQNPRLIVHITSGANPSCGSSTLSCLHLLQVIELFLADVWQRRA
ncbi:hypothetical protein Anapl_08181 [Anas platyrhynchos]|uniref:Uncharacterized protein n=1 Tax=Anas platyrhynchos TaxID=8839 RepID=R0M859_ANAPL|nr:hypothetical protein Anapl_08181 [Anas platyrhynchos]